MKWPEIPQPWGNRAACTPAEPNTLWRGTGKPHKTVPKCRAVQNQQQFSSATWNAREITISSPCLWQSKKLAKAMLQGNASWRGTSAFRSLWRWMPGIHKHFRCSGKDVFSWNSFKPYDPRLYMAHAAPTLNTSVPVFFQRGITVLHGRRSLRTQN